MQAMMISKDKPKSTVGAHNRTVKRNLKTGSLEASGDVTTNEIYADDNARKQAAKPNDGSFDGSAAPRTGGGVAIAKTGVPSGGSKKQMKAAKMRVNKSAASPQAKRSAKMIYR